jgi:hypothetical protein
MQIERPSFATFWAGGPLSPFETACIRSFTLRGYEVALFSYEQASNVPEGVTARDAREIAPREDLELFLIDGKPNLSHFSDYFRYLLFQNTRYIWIDSDILLLRKFDVSFGDALFAKESQNSICGAIMCIDSSNPSLARLIESTKAVMKKNLVWGETGPKLLTKIFEKSEVFDRAYEPACFFPIGYEDFWKAFLPEFREECEEASKDAYTVHLWNNIVTRLGFWKNIAPPLGSFLATRFSLDETINHFEGVYPANVMRQMVENWRLRKSGGDIGIRQLLYQIAPSIVRTAKHYAAAR